MKQRGGSVIEFIVVLPVIVMFMIGIIDYSVLFYDQAMLKHASTYAARYGVTKGNPNYNTASAVSTFASTYCSGKLISFAGSPPTVSVTVTPSNWPPVFGNTLTVTLTYVYTRLSYMTTLGFSATVTLTSTSKMTYE